jgi:fructan beta-fructosidase
MKLQGDIAGLTGEYTLQNVFLFFSDDMFNNQKRTCALLAILLLTWISIYSQDVINKSSEKYSPEFHFFPSIDPTGLSYFGGKYFLNWGTAVSRDLVHWEMTEYGTERNKMIVSIFGGGTNFSLFGPNSPFQSHVISIESGSMVVDWNNTTGLSQNGQSPLIAFQSRSIAFSMDTAKSWIKSEFSPKIENSIGTGDPKVFWYEPDKKWILLMGGTNTQKIKFFGSQDMKNWEYLSESGPWGAVDKAWNCVDFFPLAVDGNPANTKWVLVISAQTCNGQYFIGDFDGKRFTLDQQFIDELSYNIYKASGTMLFDFERGIDNWKLEGDAFVECPVEGGGILGSEGKRIISSAHNRSSSKGKITSPEFTITKKYINFLIGGGNYPDNECINLLIDGKVVRTQPGTDNSFLSWTGWDVSEFRGKNAQIEIVDNITEGKNIFDRGYIYCDAIMLCDELPVTGYFNPGWEKAFWIDWGNDFYAARSWSNYAPDEERNIWVGWMGNHMYRNEPVFGIISVPRSLELKTFPEGIRLIQNPVKELESLRTTHKVTRENTFEGIWQPQKFRPGKNAYELIVEFENISAEEFGLYLCVGEDEKTVIGYDVCEEKLYVDRRKSGYDEFSSVFPGVNSGPMKNRTDITKFHIFIDKCSVEVFGNNGETTISSKIYPDPGSLGIEVFSNHGKVGVKSMELWELDSIGLY